MRAWHTNGSISLWLDGELKQAVSGIDNDTLRIEQARPGPSGSLNAGTSGAEYFDAFESREQTYIGPVGGGSGESSVVTATITYTYDPLYRLTGAAYPGAYTYTFDYAYDAAGNRTVQTRTITSTLATTYILRLRSGQALRCGESPDQRGRRAIHVERERQLAQRRQRGMCLRLCQHKNEPTRSCRLVFVDKKPR